MRAGLLLTTMDQPTIAQLSRVSSALQSVHALPGALAVALAEQIQLNADDPTAVPATKSRPPTHPTQAASSNQVEIRETRVASGEYPVSSILENEFR